MPAGSPRYPTRKCLSADPGALIEWLRSIVGLPPGVSGFSVEVDALLLHHERSLVHLGVDRADVLADNPDEEELHGAEEVDADQEWRQAELNLIPEHELRDEIPKSNKQAEHGDGKSCHGGDAKGHLRVVGNSEHG